MRWAPWVGSRIFGKSRGRNEPIYGIPGVWASRLGLGQAGARNWPPNLLAIAALSWKKDSVLPVIGSSLLLSINDLRVSSSKLGNVLYKVPARSEGDFDEKGTAGLRNGFVYLSSQMAG